MGYPYHVSAPWYSVKEDKEYPWPCKSLPDRTIELFDDDVLTEMEDNPGYYMKHTGLGTFNHKINIDDLIEHTEPIQLRML